MHEVVVCIGIIYRRFKVHIEGGTTRNSLQVIDRADVDVAELRQTQVLLHVAARLLRGNAQELPHRHAADDA